MPEQKKKHPIKQLLLLFVVLYLTLSLIPAAVYEGARTAQNRGDAGKKQGALSSGSTPESSQMETEASPPPETPGTAEGISGFLEGAVLPGSSALPSEKDLFTLYDAATGKLLTVSGEEFLPAALACEMDLSAPKEALKAQAVAIYTQYSWKRLYGEKVNGGDFACDSENWQVYVPQETMRERWGEDFEENYGLLQQAAEEVYGQILLWEGKPACTTYFAISCGSTEAPENVWESSLPYLQAAASPGDAFSDGYLSKISLTAEEVKQAATQAFPEKPFDFSSAPENWFQNQALTPSGYTKSIELGGVPLSGTDLRTALSLRSACFETEYSEGCFHFTVRGWGHGVGMSQAGAVFLAQQGADYREILTYYFPGTELSVSDA